MKSIRYILIILAFTILAGTVGEIYAQKKPLDHSMYDKWQSVSSYTIPYNGKYLLYSVDEQDGDNTLYIRNIQNNVTITVPRGGKAVLSRDGETIVCIIKSFHKDRRDAKIAKKKKYEMPKDSLAVIDLKTGGITKFPFIDEYKFGTDLREILVARQADIDKSDKSGRSIFILNLRTLSIDTLNHVNYYAVSDNGERLVYVSLPDTKDLNGLIEMHSRHLGEGKDRVIFTCNRKGAVSSPFLNKTGTKVAFFAQTDTVKEVRNLRNVYFTDLESDAETELIIDNAITGIPEGLGFTDKSSLKFGTDDKYLILNLEELPKLENDSVPSFEKVDVAVWRWNDDYLPTVKNLSISPKWIPQRKEISQALYYFTRPNEILALGGKNLPYLSVPNDSKGDKILSITDKPYRIAQQWDAVNRYDIYELNLKNGSRSKLFENCCYTGFSTSPDGRYTVYFNLADSSWYLYDIIEKDLRNLTAGLPAIFWNDEEDMPRPSYQNGQISWYSDGSAFCIGSKYDVWKFDPTGKNPAENLTDGIGVANSTKFTVVKRLRYNDGLKSLSGVPVENFIVPDAPLFFSSFNTKTKETGIYVRDRGARRSIMVKLVEGKFTYKLLGISDYYGYPDFVKNKHSKAKVRKKMRVPVLVYSKGNFENPNNLYFTKDYFKTETKITDINPWQDEYNWGTVELVKWKTADGKDAEGLLYKPEDFDPVKKYPMIVYFYERLSDELYVYKNLAPSHSTVNIPFCVSNGYIVFVPNIYYEIGHPGQSAMKSIMPGVDMLCENSWIDSKHMALQGQSWGGYQTAYMITQTDRFAAAGAGAPVSNMTSAYGGIRWGTGVSRQFQYECTQSRIGKNLWDGLDLYMENSSLFFVPNIKTPVLIMHNDNDEAVPWYQGIEFFSALKRLGKKAWMLQYKNESHNLEKRHNRKDYTVKLMEFFDYYLKDASMPEWMKNNN